MKNYLFYCLALCLTFGFSVNSQAQDYDEAAAVFAHEICQCIETNFSDIDPDVVKALANMPADGDEEELNAYFEGLDEDVLMNLVGEMSKLENFEEQEDMQRCMDGIEQKMKRFEGKLESEFLNEEKFLNTVLDELDTNSECQLTYVFLKLGLATAGE